MGVSGLLMTKNPLTIPRAAFMAVVLLAVPLVAVAAPATGQTAAVELMVLGETHGTRSVTKSLVGIAQSKGATGCVCPGDFIYGDWGTNPWAWRDMMKPFMGNMMPAQGNHDWPWSDWSGLFPNGAHYYAKDVNGVHFISVNTEYSLASGSTQRNWLEGKLSERDPSALKVVFLHRPWWLPDGARHPASEFASKNGATGSAMDALMQKHGVDLVVSAHEKNHQHSLRNGVHYLVAGGGSPDFYGMGYSLPGAVKRLQANVVSTLEVTPTSMTLKSYDVHGGKVDEFTMTTTGGGASPAPAPAPAPSPAPSTGAATFSGSTGNEWWVQVKVSASGATVRSVDARDTGGAWTPLTWRSWGSWATSFRVEPGHTVEYRATLSDGRVAQSCAFTHPAGVQTCGASTAPAPAPAPAPSGFGATFSNVRGNAWWVESDVTAASGTLAGVDARVNGGSWVALGKTSWGSWAKSIHAPSGSTVEFRARSAEGAYSPTHGPVAWRG